VRNQEEISVQQHTSVLINNTTPPPRLSKKTGIYIASIRRGERYVFCVGVNLCAPTGDKKFTARIADQRNAKVSASTNGREAGVNSVKE
jgi:uncharacterized protein with PhoU and TrkA domain